MQYHVFIFIKINEDWENDMKSITANIGEKIEVKDNNGDVMGYFYFNPADPDIIRRCNVVQDKLNELTNSISDKGDINELEKVNLEIRKQMQFLLGESAGDTFFRYNSPLAITDEGILYAVYIFDIIYEFIRTEVNARSKKVKEAMEKYTRKYSDD